MSYDLYLYRTPPGRDPQEVFEEEMEIEEADESGTPPDDPLLARYSAEVEEALGDHATCYRCGGHLSINIPYHYEGAEAQRLFARLAECLHRACTQDGLTVYDPQEGRAIDPKRDLQAMIKGNTRGTQLVREVSPTRTMAQAPRAADQPKKKPWWRWW